MRSLVILLALSGCKRTEPPSFDWARCEAQIHDLASVDGDGARVAALIAACPVCGDWKPILDWNRPQAQGGPARTAIEERMTACHAWCEPNAKQFFMGTLDDARGGSSRAPWRHLAEQCKDKVSAVPDARYVSAPYFALDRIGRAVAEHGGPAADELARFYIALPEVSITGFGIDVPELARDDLGEISDNQAIVTVMGDKLFVSHRPLAHLTANGVVLATQTTPYPGDEIAADAIAKLASPSVAIVAPRKMAARALLDLLAPAQGANLELAVRERTTLPGWPTLATVPLEITTDLPANATVDELASAAHIRVKIQVKP